MRLAPRSLVTRVALTTALTVVVASASVALTAQLIARHLASVREDTTLSDAAETLALELRRPGADPHWIAADEARELAHTNMRCAVYRGDTFLEGDRGVAAVPASSCEDRGSLRTCGRPAGAWVAVVARDQRAQQQQHHRLTLASALAVLLTSVLGALVAFSIARLITSPLDRLRHAVEQVPADDPGKGELGSPSGLAEIDALRDSLRAAFARLGMAMTQSRRFASDAAHELRTPLAKLLGELELTAEHAQGEDRVGIARAQRVAERMSALVERLLILARLDTLEAPERLEVRELIEAAIETLAADARSRVVFELSEQTDALAVLGDSTLLVATLTNALENALKFSSEEVRVELDLEADQVMISIFDRGPGIDERERERVFAAFYRTASSRAGHVPGHGIGLALIEHVMTLHGGRARFLPSERGAHLALSLPLAGSRS